MEYMGSPSQPGYRVAGLQEFVLVRRTFVKIIYSFSSLFSRPFLLSPFSIRMTRTHARADYTAYSYFPFSTLVLATIYPIPYHDRLPVSLPSPQLYGSYK